MLNNFVVELCEIRFLIQNKALGTVPLFHIALSGCAVPRHHIHDYSNLVSTVIGGETGL